MKWREVKRSEVRRGKVEVQWDEGKSKSISTSKNKVK